MPKFEVQSFPERDLRIIHVSGEISYDDFQSFAADDHNAELPRFTIWMLGAGSLKLLEMEELKGLKELQWPSRPDMDEHVILVADETGEQMLAKWYKRFSDTLPSQGVTYHVAETLGAAEALVARLSRNS